MLLLISTLIICVLVSYETLARKKGYPQISTGLEEIRNYSLTFWTLLGNWISRCINFWWIFENLWEYTKEVCISFINIFKPLIQTVLSVSYFLVGFISVKNALFSVVFVGVFGYVFLYSFLYNLIVNLTQKNLIVFSNLFYSVLCFFPDYITDMLHNLKSMSVYEKKFYQVVITICFFMLCLALNNDMHGDLIALEYAVITGINLFFGGVVFFRDTLEWWKRHQYD